MKFELDYTPEEMQKAQLELLINIFAMQKATAITMIEMNAKMANDDKLAEEHIAILNNEFTKERIAIFDHLYEQRGKINPEDLYPDKDPE